MMSIRKVRFAERGIVDLIDDTLENVGPDCVRIRSQYTVISPGTELAFLHGAPNTRAVWPLFMGYTGVGVIEQLGEGVEGFAVGEQVAARLFHWSANNPNINTVAKLPNGLSPQHAAMWTLGCIALQGVRKARIDLGETVCVLGLGVIGNLAAQLCRQAGATYVAGVDPVAWRRDLSNADVTTPDVEAARQAAPQRVRDKGFDVVIEATGVPAVINTALDATRRMGRTILLGTTRGNTEQVDFCNAVHRKGVTIIGAHTGIVAQADDTHGLFTAASDQRTVLELLAAGRLDASPILSGFVTPDEAPKAFERLHARENGLMTLGIDWTQ